MDIWLTPSSVGYESESSVTELPNRKVEFVLCARDADEYYRAIMGNVTFQFIPRLNPATRHTLLFTEFHEGDVRPEFLFRKTVHRQVFEPFRKNLRGLTNIFLQGSAVGLDEQLADTVLEDFISPRIPDPGGMLLDLVHMQLPHRSVVLAIHSDWDLYCRTPGSNRFTLLLAPLEKVLSLSALVVRKQIWIAILRKTRNPTRFVEKFMFYTFEILFTRLQALVNYGLWREDAYIRQDNSQRVLSQALSMAASLQTYELCVAMPMVFGMPDRTPPAHMELELMISIANCCACFVYSIWPWNERTVTALAMGYKAAKRALGLAPEEERCVEWMRLFNLLKAAADEEGLFFDVPDHNLETRGVLRWEGNDLQMLNLLF
jgi:hypothetical protein